MMITLLLLGMQLESYHIFIDMFRQNEEQVLPLQSRYPAISAFTQLILLFLIKKFLPSDTQANRQTNILSNKTRYR